MLGGFHMLRKKPGEIKATINRLQNLNVTTVVPAHCSGDLAKKLFKTLYGKQFDTAGVGRKIVLDKGKLVINTLTPK